MIVNTMSHQRNGKLKLGLVANEFFAESLGRMGGFGVVVRQVADCFNKDPDLGVEPVFIGGQLKERNGRTVEVAHDTKLLLRPKRRIEQFRQLAAEKIDLLLTVDYRTDYRWAFRYLPRVPIIIWVHDPRTPYDMERISSIRIPGQEDIVPQTATSPRCTSLAKVVRKSRWFGRKVVFGAHAVFLKEKVLGTYGVEPPSVTFLPNIIEHVIDEPTKITKSERPSVVFLARLDPYKRPWVFSELAKHFPDVDFIFMGKSHCQGPGAWEPKDLPPNVILKGHIDGEEKVKLLSSAWVMVNTSAHEGLPISYLEALVCETPILSCFDAENVASRYGVYVGRWEGSGMEAIPKLAEELKRLLADEDLRNRLARAGKTWVKETHTKERFLQSFEALCQEAGVSWRRPS